MKNIKMIVLIAALSMIAGYAFAQDIYRNIPVPAATSFSAKYPGATVKNWKKDGNEYVARFKMDREKSSAYYDANGKWLRTETDLPLSKLPVSIRYSLRQSNFASYHIDDISDIHTPIADMYRIEVDNNSGNPVSYGNVGAMDDRLLYFNTSGHLLRSKDNNN